jgi:hypothetical protein
LTVLAPADSRGTNAAQQAVEADGRASFSIASALSPVVKYHGLARCYLPPLGLLVRPQLNGGTLDGRHLVQFRRYRPMTYFPDLSPYSYNRAHRGVLARNIGWLDPDHVFPTADPTDTLLGRLWDFCLISVQPARGGELCPLCKQHAVSERAGTRLILGSAEIWVFDRTRQFAFAAPNLIYHSIQGHHYLPPASFLEAVDATPHPAGPEYKEILRSTGLHWVPSEVNGGMFRFVRKGDEVVREWVLEPKT